MKPERLGALADGIFSIVMTLLVLDLKVPHLEDATNRMIWEALIQQVPTFVAFVVSFATLFTYWRAHNYIVSTLAKNLDNTLANWNAWFFFLIVLVPFSSHLVSLYPTSWLSIMIYGMNVILIGLALFGLRHYVLTSDKIENSAWTPRDNFNGNVRMFVPTASAVLAIIFGYFDPSVSMFLFAFGIIFNLSPVAVRVVHRLAGWFGVKVPPPNTI